MLIRKYIFIVLINLFLGACAKDSTSKLVYSKDKTNKQSSEQLADASQFDLVKKLFPNANNIPSSSNVVGKSWKPAEVVNIDSLVYPIENRKSGLQGKVIVNLLISEQGEVIDSNIAESTNVFFDQSALQSVKNWRFSPAMLDGKPCISVVRAPIAFKLIDFPEDRNSSLSLDPKLYEQQRQMREQGSVQLLNQSSRIEVIE